MAKGVMVPEQTVVNTGSDQTLKKTWRGQTLEGCMYAKDHHIAAAPLPILMVHRLLLHTQQIPLLAAKMLLCNVTG